MENVQIVKNSTEGYGYNYSSLSDIAEQGFTIPKMKTGTENDKEYIYYFDKDINDWIRGCEIVVIDQKGMNKCQSYLSAITYARRGTTQLALGLACQDDKSIENTNADGTPKEKKLATDKQLDLIYDLYDVDNIKKMLEYYKVEKLSELTMEQASQAITNKKKKGAKSELSEGEGNPSVNEKESL